jgi:hypothetical protein
MLIRICILNSNFVKARHRSSGVSFQKVPGDASTTAELNGDSYKTAIGRLMFVQDGSVTYGSYEYDEPKREDDEPRTAQGGLRRGDA